MLLKMQLFTAGLPHPTAGDPGHVRFREGGPVFRQDLLRPEHPAALAGRQCPFQVGHGSFTLAGFGQLAAAQQHKARVGALGGQDIIRLRRELFRQQSVHNGDHIPQLIPAVQRVVPQHVKKLVHIKNAAGLHQHPGKTPHGHGDELGAHPALVGVTVTPAADRLDLAPQFQQVLYQHGVHIHRAKIVFQDADTFPLPGQICRVPPQECCLARSQKARDEVYLYHLVSPPFPVDSIQS